jgi:hypothetical protein
MVLPSTSPVPSVIESQDKSLEENQSKIDNKISKVELRIYFVKKCTSTILILIFIQTIWGFCFAFFNPRQIKQLDRWCDQRRLFPKKDFQIHPRRYQATVMFLYSSFLTVLTQEVTSQDISTTQPASTTSLCARTQITSLLFSFLLFLSSYWIWFLKRIKCKNIKANTDKYSKETIKMMLFDLVLVFIVALHHHPLSELKYSSLKSLVSNEYLAWYCDLF